MSLLPRTDLDPAFEQLLGYLNFSSGAADPKALKSLDELFGWAESEPQVWRVVCNELLARLDQLSRENTAFANSTQARDVIRRTRDEVLPAYQQFHRDLLFHLDDDKLFNSFFVGRVFEVVLATPHDTPNYVEHVMSRLNDYIGHRPVPTLESQKIEPYAHEWVRPIPLYVDGAGVCRGRHQAVLIKALDLLRETDEDLLRQAQFDPDLVEEVALDSRSYDFDHPVNKRPNYHFGQWDPHRIDNQGRYRRFILQWVTLDSLLCRLESADPDIPEEDRVFEAAAVLSGTILMASGVSGWGPGCHSSHVTLGNLLPEIASYRDEFYQRLIDKLEGPLRERLQQEAARCRQPFGGARQHLNAELGRRRARQLQHVVLAKVFALMGHPEAARRQVEQVSVASARMSCSLECLITAGDRAARDGEIDAAVELLAEVRDLLIRAIECGALADPWSILGFDANFSLFPALENSVHDHRVDELVDLVERVFRLHARIWSEAAAVDQLDRCSKVEQLFQSLALWWRQFAVHEVSSVDCGDSQQAYQAAQHVAEALNLWHKGGAAAGDIAFWTPHASMFDSPKAYTLVVERLLERDDHVAAMALLVNWLSRNEELPLDQGDSSFQRCALQWLRAVRRNNGSPWHLIAKFLNYIEANAESYGQVPQFELGRTDKSSAATADTRVDGQGDEHDDDEPEDEEQGLFGAAYEGMVYRDSTDDGVDSELAGDEHFAAGEDELATECQRISGRLDFITTLATLWTMAVLPPDQSDEGQLDCETQLRHWVKQAMHVRARLQSLMKEVNSFPIPTPEGHHDSMVEYDRRRLLKESLLEQVISAQVDVSNAVRLMLAVLQARSGDDIAAELRQDARPSDEEVLTAGVIASLLQLDADSARPKFQELMEHFSGQPLLYVPLSRCGEPRQIVTARIRQHCLRDLLKLLPRAGMLREVHQVLETAREMERRQAAAQGAVTEFDELFNCGYGALVECLARSAKSWSGKAEADLVSCLEQLTESVLISWLTHSRTLRLSVLERVSDSSDWNELVDFVKEFGEDLFTQQFLNLSNVRAILHSGVDNWLRHMQEEAVDPPLLIRRLDTLDFPRVVDHLTVVLEAVMENYAEYRDYNSTTTLSDDGSMLYSLLDFLRLRARYDRVCWHLKPVVLAHQILVRNHLDESARLWRRALSERIHEESDRYLTQLRDLQTEYAIRLPTIADRLGERFIKPLAVDRLVALVRPAMREEESSGSCPVFELLEHEAESLASEPSGAGLDVPHWLLALDEEVQRVRLPEYEQELHIDELGLDTVELSREQIQDELENWDLGS